MGILREIAERRAFDRGVRSVLERLTSGEAVEAALEAFKNATAVPAGAMKEALRAAVGAAQETGGDDAGEAADVFLVWGTNYVPDEDHTLLSVHASEEGARAVLDGVGERDGRFVAALLPEWEDVPFDRIAGPDRREVLAAPAPNPQEGRRDGD